MIARLLYALIFVAGVPLLLMLWAVRAAPLVPLPALHSAWLGGALFAAGCALMLAGWFALYVHGGGLPMNAFPPPRFVRQGVFRYVGNPIYIGFALCCAAASVFYGSAAGLWLVTPVTVLAMAALVIGYERHDLRARFGDSALTPPRFALPRNEPGAPSAGERLGVYLHVLLPWLVLYEALHLAGVPRDAVESYLPFERELPVLQWTELIYATPYLVVLAVPLLVRTRAVLREFAVRGLIATFSVTLVYVLVPLIAPPRSFAPQGWLGELLALERVTSNTVAAFPAFHVIWALLAANALARARPRLRFAAWVWAIAVAISCVTVGMHSIADIVSAIAAYLVVARYRGVWELLRRAAERLANSWHEWRVGRVRIINHGAYAGLAGAIGVYVAGLTTQLPVLTVVFVGVAVVIGAGAWAQWLEGSSVLLRPFGYYGGIIGGITACLLAGLLGYDALLLLGGFALGAPWVQISGRLRCLVQGCCHGAPASARVGIRFLQSRSRVAQIAGLAGVPLHPTQLYSILSNIVIGLLLFRFWKLGAAPALIVGLYLMLNPIARFVEESYRGEPQTPIIARLRIYQWLSIASLLAGMVVIMLRPGGSFPAVAGVLDWGYAGVAALMFVIVGAAMGVDFPDSSQRFSRLAASDRRADLLPEPPEHVTAHTS